MQPFLSKDFIRTAEDLVFAVVDSALEAGKVLCFLRYVREGETWRKVDTAAANALLTGQYPQYLHYSVPKDAYLHAVPVASITHHYLPQTVLQELLNSPATDAAQQDLQALCALFRGEGLPLAQFGITGSLLISAQRDGSDLDLVVYERDCFHAARAAMQRLLAGGALQALDASVWQDTFERRNCALNLDEYIWHERRKYNKALINGRKFDLSFVAPCMPEPQCRYRKLGTVELCVRVKEARYAFDYPALWLLEHPEIGACLSFTATYTGQAETGEWIRVRGQLEEAESGERRIVVGSSREAPGEFIKISGEHA